MDNPCPCGKCQLAADDSRHGTFNAYNNLGCRCTPCKAANVAQWQESRERRKAGPIPEHVHGTENGYRNYGCDCDRCKDAWAKVTRARSRARRNRLGHDRRVREKGKTR